MSTLAVKNLESADNGRWDEFVSKSAAATFFHRAGWRRVLHDAFGHDTHYLYAERSGIIEGVLPLGRIKSRLFGDALISTPFCVYGGVVAESREASDALLNHATALANDMGVDYLEVRNLASDASDAWPGKSLYVTFRKNISADVDVNLKAIPRKQRAMIRKGEQAGLRVQLEDDTVNFYDIYSQSVRDLGTPVFSRRYFDVLQKEFGSACEIITVWQGDLLVAGCLSFYFRNEVVPYYGGGNDVARNVKANDYMYWDLMSRAAARGVEIFDYGRSKVDTGSYRFKKHWGFEPKPLNYRYHLVRARDVPDVSPANPKYQLFVAGWRRMPLIFHRIVGPWLARSLG